MLTKYIDPREWKQIKSNHLLRLALKTRNIDVIEVLLKDGRITDDGSILDMIECPYDLILMISYITYPTEKVKPVLRKLHKRILSRVYSTAEIDNFVGLLYHNYPTLQSDILQMFEYTLTLFSKVHDPNCLHHPRSGKYLNII